MLDTAKPTLPAAMQALTGAPSTHPHKKTGQAPGFTFLIPNRYQGLKRSSAPLPAAQPWVASTKCSSTRVPVPVVATVVQLLPPLVVRYTRLPAQA